MHARASRLHRPRAMDRLDVATALAIRERLGARDLARSCAVCREFTALANDDTLWRGLSSRETHALVGADELPASSTSATTRRSVAKRLYLCNRGWVDGEVHRDGSCHTRDDAFVEAAFADPSDGAPGAPPARGRAAFAGWRREKRRLFLARRARHRTRCSTAPTNSVTGFGDARREHATGRERRRRGARRACARSSTRNPDVSFPACADGTLRASRVSSEPAPLRWNSHASAAGGRARRRAGRRLRDGGRAARALVVSVDELRRASSAARGVPRRARPERAFPQAIPRRTSSRVTTRRVASVRPRARVAWTQRRTKPPVSPGGWCATRDATTALRRGDASSGGGLFAGTAGGASRRSTWGAASLGASRRSWGSARAPSATWRRAVWGRDSSWRRTRTSAGHRARARVHGVRRPRRRPGGRRGSSPAVRGARPRREL